MKKLLCVFLSLTMLLSLTAGLTFTASADGPISGTCGDNITYSLEETTGTLTISGTGAMTNYAWNDSPFNGLSVVKKVVIGNGVTTVGNNAFRNCGGLTDISIPSSATVIGTGAFRSCTALTAFTLPASITALGKYVFLGCDNLTSLNVAAGNTVYDSRNNCNAIIHTADNTLLFGCDATVIPDNLVAIEEYALFGCDTITSVSISKSVRVIGPDAFGSCPNITTMTVDAANPKYDSRGDCNAIIETETDTLIAGCKNTVIPDGVTCIGETAFDECTGLTSINIPLSVTKIELAAFFGCLNLKTVFYDGTPEDWQKITVEEENEYLTRAAILYKTVSIAEATVTGVKNKVYTGKAQTQSVTVKLDGKTLVKDTDYTVSYQNNTKVGTATVLIQGKGIYTGTVKKTFFIRPKKTAVSKLTRGKKAFTAKWKKVGGITGYQVQYSLKSSFKGARTKTVKGAAKTKLTVKKLKKNKKYYVRVRAYQKVGGKTYYASWSKARKVKTK